MEKFNLEDFVSSFFLKKSDKDSHMRKAGAEAVLDKLATIWLWVGTIVCGLAIIAGVVLSFITMFEVSFGSGLVELILFPIITVITYFFTFILVWALIKMFVNISRNLFEINHNTKNPQNIEIPNEDHTELN